MAPKKQDAGDDQDSIHIDAPGGFSATVRGAAWTSKEVLVSLLTVICTAFLWWTQHGYHEKRADTERQTHELLATVIGNQNIIMKQMANNTSLVSEGDDMLVYVLTLTQSQREKLNLAMPTSLRKKMQNGREPH